MQLLRGYCSTVKLEILPHSQMKKDGTGRKSGRRHRSHINDLNENHSSKRSESCDYQPATGVRSFGTRARSHEKPLPSDRRKTQKVQRWGVLKFGGKKNIWLRVPFLPINSYSNMPSFRFTSNAVEQQKRQGLSGSVPAVHHSSPPAMIQSNEFSRSVHVDSGNPPSSRSTGKQYFFFTFLSIFPHPLLCFSL